ncbi:MAG: hypothetical protein HY343_10275 [Lentisphaerae bacterium]|nr:hypothetical protein [Lentisphaerota bacterium]
MNILAIAAGSLMVLSKVWPWLRGRSEKGPRFYKPDAHTDVIISIGSWSISGDRVLTFAALVGLVLILVGAVGVWRTMK